MPSRADPFPIQATRRTENSKFIKRSLMSCSGQDFDSDSECCDPTGDVLPVADLQTPAQIPYQFSFPLPFYAFTPYAIPFTPNGTPLNTPHQGSYPMRTPSCIPKNSAASPTIGRQKPTRRYQTVREKLDEVFSLLQEFNWTMGDLLYFIFRIKDNDGHKIKKRSEAHAKIASRFLGGFSKHGPADIVELWVKSPWGIPKKGRWEREAMFSVEHDFRCLKSARPAITSFAVQIVRERLRKDIQNAVKKENGLHSFTTGARDISDGYYGSNTLAETTELLKKHQPIAWNFLVELATPRSQKRGGVVAIRYRPPQMVAAQALSAISFSRNMHAKRLPLDKALLYFACRANRYLFAWDSRLGTSASYTAVYNSLQMLAKHDLDVVKQLGTSPTSAVRLCLDNVQSYVRPRDFRIGREARMVTGTASTAIKVEGFNPHAFDLVNKQHRITENKRKSLTVEQLWGSIDHAHIELICVLQWVRVIVDFAPQLAGYKADVRRLYRTEGQKYRAMLRKSQIYPLPTNGRNETITSELAQSLRMIYKHIGQTESSYTPRLILTGGDGLTYERMVQLKNYLQFHETAYERLDILEPLLEIWHTEWTDLSRIYEAHWDSLTSQDPSSLGHSANKIKRKAPSNIKKVDYYPYLQLAYLVLDARMLDCWRIVLCGKDGDLLKHLELMATSKSLPTMETLLEKARLLQEMYGIPGAFDRALRGAYHNIQIPEGSAWERPAVDKALKIETGQKQKDNKHTERDFKGDAVLGQSSRFIYDAMISRHTTYAVADGDIGSVWECMKMMLFTFSGSSHNKYASYLLEMFCNLELESNQELRTAIFENWLVNPTGLPGHSVPGDLYQEQLQDEMYEHIGRKDAGFENPYVQNIVAPNVHRFVRVKKELHESLGLARRSGKHVEPHSHPEIRKLMDIYQGEELHLFRQGRTYGRNPSDVDDFGRGMVRLQDGKLESWILETTRARGLNNQTSVPDIPAKKVPNEMDDPSILDTDGAENYSCTEMFTQGSMRMENGDLIIEIAEERDMDDEEGNILVQDKETSEYEVSDVEQEEGILGTEEAEDWARADHEF